MDSSEEEFDASPAPSGLRSKRSQRDTYAAARRRPPPTMFNQIQRDGRTVPLIGQWINEWRGGATKHHFKGKGEGAWKETDEREIESHTQILRYPREQRCWRVGDLTLCRRHPLRSGRTCTKVPRQGIFLNRCTLHVKRFRVQRFKTSVTFFYAQPLKLGLSPTSI